LAVCFAPLRDYCPDTITNIHLALLGLAPPSPPQVEQPTLPTRTLFEQGLSDKLHNSLVIKNKSQTKQPINSLSAKSILAGEKLKATYSISM
jgi:hypothetical protein